MDFFLEHFARLNALHGVADSGFTIAVIAVASVNMPATMSTVVKLHVRGHHDPSTVSNYAFFAAIGLDEF